MAAVEFAQGKDGSRHRPGHLNALRCGSRRQGSRRMPTDWNLIREMMAAAIDSCEQIEAAGYSEQDRDLTIDVSGQTISVHEFMVGAWTLPENLRYRIIRDRQDKSIDLPYPKQPGLSQEWQKRAPS